MPLTLEPLEPSGSLSSEGSEQTDIVENFELDEELDEPSAELACLLDPVLSSLSRSTSLPWSSSSDASPSLLGSPSES